MKDGEIMQVDAPIDIYQTPANMFTAGFIGLPPMNFLNGSLQEDAAGVWFVTAGEQASRLSLTDELAQLARQHAGESLTLGVRPEHFALCGAEDSAAIHAQVEVGEPLGALHREPRLWEQIKSTPSKLPELLEESLRFDAPVPHSEQFTIREIEVGGIRIPPNQKVMAFIALANRDPDIFKAPHQFNPERQNANKHLSFGAGPHACLGAHLARMIATHLFISLSEQFSHFELQVGPNEIDWLATTFLRGPRKLPVRFYK